MPSIGRFIVRQICIIGSYDLIHLHVNQLKGYLNAELQVEYRAQMPFTLLKKWKLRKLNFHTEYFTKQDTLVYAGRKKLYLLRTYTLGNIKNPTAILKDIFSAYNATIIKQALSVEE